MNWSGSLNPEAAALLAAFEAQGVPPYDRLSVLQARAVVAGSTRLQGPRLDVASVQDLLVEGDAGRLPVRVYHPAPGEGLPLLVYLHGGGFVTGSVAVADRPCRALALAAHCVVASVEYRLAPESPFPAGLQDAVAATRQLAEHAVEIGADPARLVLAGDSAGATLAAAAARVLRADGPPVARQLLLYPTLIASADFPSRHRNGEGYGLTAGSLDWFWAHYLSRPGDTENPLAAPLRAADLAGLPPATIVVAEFDPLRDEGIDYAERLHSAGVEVELHAVQGAIHGYWWMAGELTQSGELTAWLGRHLRDVLV